MDYFQMMNRYAVLLGYSTTRKIPICDHKPTVHISYNVITGQKMSYSRRRGLPVLSFVLIAYLLWNVSRNYL